MYNTNLSIVYDAVWILRITDFKIFLQFILQFFFVVFPCVNTKCSK